MSGQAPLVVKMILLKAKDSGRFVNRFGSSRYSQGDLFYIKDEMEKTEMQDKLPRSQTYSIAAYHFKTSQNVVIFTNYNFKLI